MNPNEVDLAAAKVSTPKRTRSAKRSQRVRERKKPSKFSIMVYGYSNIYSDDCRIAIYSDMERSKK